jgi:hypothetical protein
VKPADPASKPTLKMQPVIFCTIILIASTRPGPAQSIPYQRTFPQPKTALRSLPAWLLSMRGSG